MSEKERSGQHSSIADEHVEIRAILETLSSTSEPDRLLPLLKHLLETLESHFVNEEGDGGLHAVLDECAPRYANRIDQLLAEHRELLDLSRGLVRQGESVVETMTQLREDVKSLADRIALHDEAESEMLSEAYLLDLGGGD